MRITNEAALAAAAWWRKQLAGPPGRNNGADREPENPLNSPMAKAMMAMAFATIGKATDEQLDRFEQKIAEVINLRSALGAERTTLGVDYDPDLDLATAARACGIELDRFPWKTVMWIDGDKVEVSVGYGGELEVIHDGSAPKERKSTDTHRGIPAVGDLFIFDVEGDSKQFIVKEVKVRPLTDHEKKSFAAPSRFMRYTGMPVERPATLTAPASTLNTGEIVRVVMRAGTNASVECLRDRAGWDVLAKELEELTSSELRLLQGAEATGDEVVQVPGPSVVVGKGVPHITFTLINNNRGLRVDGGEGHRCERQLLALLVEKISRVVESPFDDTKVELARQTAAVELEKLRLSGYLQHNRDGRGGNNHSCHWFLAASRVMVVV